MSSKNSPSKVPLIDISRFCPSAFTLTFVVEVVGIDVWHDCNEGWLDLGPIDQGIKLTYQLYPGQTFEVEIAIWPHVAKVYHGTNYDWVRTWQFLERRWLTFTIRHAFPVRVMELRNFVATVTPHHGLGVLSATARSEKATEVYLPPLRFRERRQFAQVVESEYPLRKEIEDMIWFRVVVYIPTSYMDGLFDTPYPVQDIRHQDAALFQVQNVILNRAVEEPVEEVEVKQAKKKPVEIKYEIQLSGDWILAGIGRVIPFQVIGDRPPDGGEIMVLISSTNLPAYDDYPVFFVNSCNLTEIPTAHLIKNRFTHLYTRWTLSEEDHCSEPQTLQSKKLKTEINFDDHHSLPLSNVLASEIMCIFLDEPFQVELRGIRTPPPVTEKPKFFGYEKGDRDFGIGVPPPFPNQDVDVLLAQTRIDARALTKINGGVNGEFPLYPPEVNLVPLDREGICTNDINAVRAKLKPDLVIQPAAILEAQMSLEISMGLVGCKPQQLTQRYSRLYCLISDASAIMTILRLITEINENVIVSGNRQGLLTGFGLDTGDTVMLYVEGPKEGQILRVWERTADFYPTVKPVFSTAAKYRTRLYPELLIAAMPFNILKMFVPLSVLLGLTPIYARPSLPVPTRSAVLKIGRLVASKFNSAPCHHDMPTALELKSFRLELCVAPRPPPVTISDIPVPKPNNSASCASVQKKAPIAIIEHKRLVSNSGDTL
uniref:Uncharacterized protein n=1 Tax=Heliothis virescens TaxID=7102 RepID=A0A2A4JG64_HELVI